MALKLATAQKPPKRRIGTSPKQEHTSKKKEVEEEDHSKPCAEIPDDVEVKYDPSLGALVEVDENRHHNNYPSCDCTTRVAKCVYCEKIRAKQDMRCLGQNFKEKGSLKYVWACRGCNSLNPAWQKISKQYKFDPRISRMWNYDVAKDKPIRHSDEEEKAVGRQIVEKKLEEVNKAIAENLDRGLKKVGKKFASKVAKVINEAKERRMEKNRQKFAEKYGRKSHVPKESERGVTAPEKVAAREGVRKRGKRNARSVVIRRA